MDSRKSPNSRRSKRQGKQVDDNVWDCSVCTYRNTAEAFKCLMCDVRKGTSTRKPRINPQLVAQQAAQQQFTNSPQQQLAAQPVSMVPVVPKATKLPGIKSDKKGSNPDPEIKSDNNKRPRLKNIDRSSAQHKAVTVNDVTVIITEFQPKRRLSSDDFNNTQNNNFSQMNATHSHAVNDASKRIDSSRVT
ncbi:YAF2 (predicted) [Pycnogonum litorale]